MGLMSNKVTRRIALGSIAGGLGGAALILHVLKRRYEVDLPSVDGSSAIANEEAMQVYKAVRPVKVHDPKPEVYDRAWAQYVKTVDVPIETISGPPSFVLNYPVQVGTNARIQSVLATYTKSTGDVQYPKPPFFFTITEGRVSAIAPIVDSKPTLLIVAEKSVMKSLNCDQESRCGECILVPTPTGADYYERRGGTVKRVRRFEVNLPCYCLAALVAFRYPIGEPLSKGTKWTTPKQEGDEGEFSCEVVGFAMVEGRKTAVIKAEQRVSGPLLPPSVAIVGGKGTKEEAMQLEKELSAETQGLKSVKTVHVTAYVDLNSGIAVRQEVEAATRVANAPEMEGAVRILSRVVFDG